EHNLKNIDVRIPRDKMVVITGLSGSGKSSLAFDTIYAEGQRRYVESLSAYARQFLGQMEKPDVDFIEGLSPAVSIDQKGSTRNPRSTVGTVTEIYDHMRLLFARVGVPHCPNHGVPIVAQTVQEIVDQIQALPEGSRILVLGPLARDPRGRLLDRRDRATHLLLQLAARGMSGLHRPRDQARARPRPRARQPRPVAESGRRPSMAEIERDRAVPHGHPRRPGAPLQVLARRAGEDAAQEGG